MVIGACVAGAIVLALLSIPILRDLAPQNTAEGKQASDAVPVAMARVSRADVPIYLHGLGTVQAFNSVLVRTRVDGQIKKVDYTEGQSVHAGDLLVEVDPATFEAQLAQTVAVEARDRAQLDNARLDLGRMERLLSGGASTAQQRDTARALVAQLEASVKADRAQADAARLQVDFSRIRSPIDGRVGSRLVDVGNIVRASEATSIVAINQIRPIFVSFTLPAANLPLLRAQMKSGAVEVTATDHDGKEIARGRLAVVDNQINVTTASIALKALFDNGDEALWPGLFVNAEVLLRRETDALTVPVTAIQYDEDGAYVFVVDRNNVAKKEAVKVAFTNTKLAVIANGLRAGDRVVTDGQYRIEDGSEVRDTDNGDRGAGKGRK